jgi:hypothetical protein
MIGSFDHLITLAVLPLPCSSYTIYTTRATMSPSDSKAPLNPQRGPPPPLMIHVTAPATLPAGYTFEAQINGDESKVVTIEVVR